MPYVPLFHGFNPPVFRPQMVVLPYVLGEVGPTNALKGGVDLKYPVSTTLTGVASLFPDFQTIEQAVSDLSFSYTEKFVPDRRPFFVEGSNFFQDSYLFYSQRIPYVDEGVKLVGKQGKTTVYALATDTAEPGNQRAVVTDLAQDFGLYSGLSASFLSNDETGQETNEVAQLGGQYGYAKGSRENTILGNVTGSWLGGGPSDRNDWVQITSRAGHGKLGGSASFTETGRDFTNQLGLVTETDLRGYSFNLNQFDNYDKGKLETYQINLNGSTFRHMSGGFFHDDLGFNTYWMLRSGLAFELDADAGKYFPYVDNTLTTGISWNQKTLFHRGGITLQIGHRQDQPYQFLSINQGLLVSKPFSLQLSFGYEKVDGSINTQTILTGTYRLNSRETIGGRILQQNGDVDAYLSYGRRVVHGTDMFVLLGDPNSPRTRGQVIVKLVFPF